MEIKNVQKLIPKTLLLRKFSDTIFKNYAVILNDKKNICYDIFLIFFGENDLGVLSLSII
jgi:hypothetical protein